MLYLLNHTFSRVAIIVRGGSKYFCFFLRNPRTVFNARLRDNTLLDATQVKGLVCNLFEVNDPIYATALEKAAGGKVVFITFQTCTTSKIEQTKILKRVCKICQEINFSFKNLNIFYKLYFVFVEIRLQGRQHFNLHFQVLFPVKGRH